MWHCRPLREMEFRDAISDSYFTATKFNFGLSKAQVCGWFYSVNLNVGQVLSPVVHVWTILCGLLYFPFLCVLTLSIWRCYL